MYSLEHLALISSSSSTMDVVSTATSVPTNRRKPQNGDAINIGSWGHPEACRKPCLYFSQGICRSGASCGYCHMPHKYNANGLDKWQRQIFHQMSNEDVVALIFPHLCDRVVESQFPEESQRILNVVGEELPQRWKCYLDQQAFERFNRTLEHLPLSSLVALICKKYDRLPFAVKVSREMNHLRATVAHLVNL